MSEKDNTDETKPVDKNLKEESNEFNNLMDATCQFFKSVYPYTRDLIKKLKGKSDSAENIGENKKD
jgi:hypothetical protein